MNDTETKHTDATSQTSGGRNVTVIGIGRAGVRAAAALYNILPENIHLCDTDKNELGKCTVPEACKHLLDKDWRGGTGTGGNFTNAQRSMARERQLMEDLVKGADFLVVMAGLGGGTGTAGAVALAGIARRLQIPAVFLVTLPFSMEGRAKQRLAETNWRDLTDIADATIALPNDLLFSAISADVPIADAFTCADAELARVCTSIITILKDNSVLSADFAVLSELLHSKKSYCGIGTGRVKRSESLNPGHMALEKMLESPYLGGPAKLKEADAVLLAITGDEKLSFGEATSILTAAGDFIDSENKMVLSAAAESGFGDYLQVTALTVKYLNQPLEAAAPSPVFDVNSGELFPLPKPQTKNTKSKKQTKTTAIQPSLPLEPVSRGIFIKTAQSIYNGADLDIPTWQRRDVHIDKGE